MTFTVSNSELSGHCVCVAMFTAMLWSRLKFDWDLKIRPKLVSSALMAAIKLYSETFSSWFEADFCGCEMSLYIKIITTLLIFALVNCKIAALAQKKLTRRFQYWQCFWQWWLHLFFFNLTLYRKQMTSVCYFSDFFLCLLLNLYSHKQFSEAPPVYYKSRTPLLIFQLTKEGQHATGNPHQQGHSHTSGVLQDSLWWDEDPGSDDGPNDDGDASEQGHLLPQFYLSVLTLEFCPVWGSFVSICCSFSVSRCRASSHLCTQCLPRFFSLWMLCLWLQTPRLCDWKLQNSELRLKARQACSLSLSPPTHQPSLCPPSLLSLSLTSHFPARLSTLWHHETFLSFLSSLHCCLTLSLPSCSPSCVNPGSRQWGVALLGNHDTATCFSTQTHSFPHLHPLSNFSFV